MIKKLLLHRFKQFKDTEIDLRDGVSFVVGGNNSGKSSILQAFAIWEFCKTIVVVEKGAGALVQGTKAAGVGLGDDEFTPINVPSLRHLWTNLKTQKIDEPDGYTLKIKLIWEDSNNVDKSLGFGLALANDRLFVKVIHSDLSAADSPPKIAYLPPFAGITDREARLTPAMRNRLVGQGLSGGVIRNVLYEMLQKNQAERTRLKGARKKISSAELNSLRASDPWELLSTALQEVFNRGITIVPFNELYHSYIRVETYLGQTENGRFKKFPNYTPRDLMVEGSGFLQWLSVYALLISPDFQLVLLDEPDAHLHTALQTDLVTRLRCIGAAKKQIFLASHSSEIIKAARPAELLQVKKGTAKYLNADSQKISLLTGIGCEYAPRIHRLQVDKRLVLVEGDSDERLLNYWMTTLGHGWPNNVVCWVWPAGHKERRQLFGQLKSEIPALIALSLRDRDDESDNTVDDTLRDGAHQSVTPDFTPLKWRRRHIENYLLAPPAIARAAGITEQQVADHLAMSAIVVPQNYTDSAVAMAIRDARGKEIFYEGNNTFELAFNVTRDDIAKAMEPVEIGEDVKTFCNRIIDLSNLPIN